MIASSLAVSYDCVSERDFRSNIWKHESCLYLDLQRLDSKIGELLRKLGERANCSDDSVPSAGRESCETETEAVITTSNDPNFLVWRRHFGVKLDYRFGRINANKQDDQVGSARPQGLNPTNDSLSCLVELAQEKNIILC